MWFNTECEQLQYKDLQKVRVMIFAADIIIMCILIIM